jgi:predicted choloylglycine hydrolase
LPAKFPVFRCDALKQIPIENGFSILRRSDRGTQDRVSNLAARELSDSREPIQLRGVNAVLKAQVRQP